MVGKRLVNTGGEADAAALDPLQNFETVTYTGNGGTQKITGYIRKGAAFNGSDSRINTNDNKAFVANEMSISLWCRLNATGAEENIISNWNSSGTRDTSFQFTITSANKLQLIVYASNDSADYKKYVSDSALTGLTDWNHFSFTLTSGITAKLYVNGSEVTTTVTNGATYTSGTINTTGTFDTIIGAIGNAGTAIDGKIDQVRIFNTALNSTQVGELADEDYTDPKKSTTDYFGNGSGVALYELDEDANDTGTTASTIDTVDIFGDSSLTDYYKLDGGLTNEKSGGTSLQSGSSTFGDGILGQALYLSGGQTASQTSTSYGSMNISGSYSVSFYFKATTVGKRNMLWYLESIGGYSNQVELGSDNRLYFGGATITSQTYSANTWYHLAISSNASNGLIEAYVNGQPIGSRTANSGSGSTQCFGHGSVGLTGYIDQVRIFNKIISDSNAATLYEATSYNGTPTNINFLGMAFQPDLVWVKARTDTTSHAIFDSVRGASKWLSSNSTSRQETYTDTLTSFDNNGYTVSNSSAVNGNNVNYVAWCWKAGGTVSANNNTDGTITSTVSANQDAGFSIVKWTGTGAINTIGHGLSSAPKLIFIKPLDVDTTWQIYAEPIGNNQKLSLGGIYGDDEATSTTRFDSTSPTSSVFTFRDVGISGDFIAYCFHSVEGYQKVGSYTGGTGEVDVTTGFKPRWVMIKNTSNSASWVIFDSIRSGTTNPINDVLEADTSDAEAAVGTAHIDIVDNGFQVNNTTSFSINNNGDTYIYLAIA